MKPPIDPGARSALRATLPQHVCLRPSGRILAAIDLFDMEAGVGYRYLERSSGQRRPPADPLRVIATMDDTPHGLLRHVSISYADHNPKWEDLKEVREAFFPEDVDVMQILPRPEDYVDLHPFCFHLWAMPEKWGLR